MFMFNKASDRSCAFVYHYDLLLRGFRLSHDETLRGRDQGVRRRAHLHTAHTNHAPSSHQVTA